MAVRKDPTTDRRINRTRLALRQAAVALLEERGWDEISVEDVCRLADVGRSTFYTHFQTKEELLASSLQGLKHTLQSAVGPAGSLAFLRGLVEHVLEHRRLFRSVVGRRSSHVVQQRFRGMVAELVKDDFARLAKSGWRRDAAASFVSGGLVEALGWWLDAKNPPSSDEVESYLRAMCNMWRA
jgi:AcrR family transcriptional regulator